MSRIVNTLLLLMAIIGLIIVTTLLVVVIITIVYVKDNYEDILSGLVSGFGSDIFPSESIKNQMEEIIKKMEQIPEISRKLDELIAKT